MNNLEYRDWFRKERIPKNYNPLIHVGFNLSVLLLLILGNFLQIQNWNWGVLGIFFITVLLGNVAVFVIHKYILHQRLKLASFAYDIHTVEHHRFFIASNITYTDSRDFYAVFFPTFVVAGFAFLIEPIFFYSMSGALGKDLGHAFTGAAAAYFLAYEFFHWASHLPEDHWLMNCRWLKYMREHHRAHHDPKLMSHYNFCIVYPMMDILMGTKHHDT